MEKFSICSLYKQLNILYTYHFAMEIRKVQKVSTGTFIVSLPKDWVVRNHVRQGTVLSIEESTAGHLLVGTHARTQGPQEQVLQENAILEESLIACYIMGARKVIITHTAARARILTILQ